MGAGAWRARAARRLAAICCLAAACGSGGAAGPELPEGALLSARSADLDRLLGLLAGMEGTPLGRLAAGRAGRLPDCPELEARADAPAVDALLAGLRCREPGGALAPLHARRGEAAIAFVWPRSAAGRVSGDVSLDASGGARVSLSVPGGAWGASALLLPGSESPGPAVLARGELFHARLRPEGGLDLATLVPEGSQGDRLFRLKSELFAGAILDGTWETAMYLPAPGETLPPMALALGFQARAAAVRAIETFIADLQQSWPVRRSAFRAGDAAGACLLDLRILPAFAPCYVATGAALIVGWNPESVRRALAPRPAPAPLAEGGAVLELERLSEADAVLREGRADLPSGPLPWRRLRASGSRRGDAVRIDLDLEPRESA